MEHVHVDEEKLNIDIIFVLMGTQNGKQDNTFHLEGFSGSKGQNAVMED